ncbi:MAG: 2-phospho-L-lactate guanylyltransferase [Ilumatobacteraceae bacterium]
MASQRDRRTGAVIIPLKGFAKAKERLSAVLDPATRALLAELTAAAVIEEARVLPDVSRVIVVTDDEAGAEWARRAGAEALIENGGLNASVTLAYRHVGDTVDWVMICHADVVHPERLAALPTPGDSQVVLVRDRHRDGTNVMVLPAGREFDVHYGAGSAEAHRRECDERGLRPVEVIDTLLGIDVDVPDDLQLVPDRLRTRLGFSTN